MNAKTWYGNNTNSDLDELSDAEITHVSGGIKGWYDGCNWHYGKAVTMRYCGNGTIFPVKKPGKKRTGPVLL